MVRRDVGRHVQLHLRSATIERGTTTVLHDVSLTVGPGDRIGLVGPNGAGKSSLLAALAGELPLRSGTVEVVPAGATVGLLAQELDAGGWDGAGSESSGGESCSGHGGRAGGRGVAHDRGGKETVAAYLGRRTGVAEASELLDEATRDLAGDESAVALDRYQRALDRWLTLGGADLDERIDVALAEVGLVRSSHDRGDRRSLRAQPAATLSGGQQARLGLAAVLLSRHDVLLLDEPTNDLDQAGLEMLEALVTTSRGPVVVVSHDRRFLERVTTAIVELDAHQGSLTRYNESFQGYLRARELARAEEERRYQVNQQERSRLTEQARRQRQWATKGVRAEQNPSDNDRAARGFRIEQTEKLASRARRTERALARLEKQDKPWEPWELRFTIGEVERSGDLVAELVDAEVVLGSFQLGPVSLLLEAGERMVVQGANGQGKTSLIRALFGRTALAAGRQRTGRSAVVGWLDQSRAALTGDRTALEVLVGQTGIAPRECRSVLAKFGLGADHLDRPSEQLSPGERTRAVLALFQARGVNTLVLDEPTNHLDLPAIGQLESALARFGGTLVLVTHDRAFLESVTLTRALTVDGGRITADELR
jgi:ATPase subunit of ABC transporter with duplicated ATPase domains